MEKIKLKLISFSHLYYFEILSLILSLDNLSLLIKTLSKKLKKII